jgi:hypothetical protein
MTTNANQPSGEDPLDSSAALTRLKDVRQALRDAEADLDVARSVNQSQFTGTPSTQLEKKNEKIEAAGRLVEERRRTFEVASEDHREASRVRDAIAADKLAKSNNAAASSVASWTKVLAILALAQGIAAAAQAYAACSPPRIARPDPVLDAGKR